MLSQLIHRTHFSLPVREITNQQSTNTPDSDEWVITRTDDLIIIIIIIRCDGSRATSKTWSAGPPQHKEQDVHTELLQPPHKS